MAFYTAMIRIEANNAGTARDFMADIVDYAENDSDLSECFRQGINVEGDRLTASDFEDDNRIADIADSYIVGSTD